MKKKGISWVIIAFLALFPVFTANAAGINGFIQIEKLIEKYLINSSKAEDISLNDNKQQGDDYTVLRKIKDIEKQIEENKENIIELENQRYSRNVTFDYTIECQNNVDRLRVNGYEMEMQLEQYKLQEKQDLIYAEYSEKITLHNQSILELEAHQLLTNIYINNSKALYLSALQKQKEHELDVCRERMKIGYANEKDVLAFEAELKRAEAELEACENETDMFRLEYEINSGILPQEFVIEDKSIDYNYEKWLKKFEEKSFYSEYYREQGKYFQEYSDIISGMPERMRKEKSEDKYRICGMNEENTKYFEDAISYFNDEAAYYANEAALYENKAAQYEENIKMYVHRICGTAETLCAQQLACEAELVSAEKQYEIALKTFEMGRITEAELLSIETLLYSSEYELAKINAQLSNYNYIFENLIENL